MNILKFGKKFKGKKLCFSKKEIFFVVTFLYKIINFQKSYFFSNINHKLNSPNTP